MLETTVTRVGGRQGGNEVMEVEGPTHSLYEVVASHALISLVLGDSAFNGSVIRALGCFDLDLVHSCSEILYSRSISVV